MNKLSKIKQKIRKFFKFLLCKLKGILGAVLSWIKKHKILTAVICIILVIALTLTVNGLRFRNAINEASLELKVEYRDIEESISDSTVVEPNNEYSITASVAGEILSDPFEEGDTVKKGDLMYTIDATTVENSIQSADIAIAKAKKAYDDAVNENTNTYRDKTSSASTVQSAAIAAQKAQQSYNDALKARDDLALKTNYSGVVTTLYVSAGDTVAAGTKIADVVDNDTLKIKIPFNTNDADNIYVGEYASLTLTKNGSAIDGYVTEISDMTESGAGFTSFRRVTIEVSNPGAVSSGDSATAMINGMACNDAGTFENITEDSITASSSGKLDSLYISEGERIYSGATIGMLDADSVESQITSAKLSLDDANQALERAKASRQSSDSAAALNDSKLSSSVSNAKLAYDDAVLAKDKLLKQLEDYTIKAPISGTVVTKNMKKGDNIGSGSSSTSSYSSAGAASSGSSSAASVSASSSAMAVIYDMSKLKCTLNVDELDVKNVRVGQKVSITTDVNDKEYTGTVETVSVNGTAGSNGVTTYPVKIDIIDFDSDLLPGMNIEASIVISSAHNVLSIPVSSLNRGNTVYIKGDKTDENDSAPEGYRTVTVVTGASDDEYIEIKNGLAEGDVLYSSSSSATPFSDQSMTEQREHAMDNMGSGGGPGGGVGPGGGM